MERLFIEHTEDTPRVDFDKERNTFQIIGRSLPENAVAFYNTLFDWLREYSKAPNEKSNVDFQLDYFNTASAKQITKLMLILQALSEQSDITIRWYYLEEDTDIKGSGLRFQRLINANIQLIEMDED